MMTYWVIFLLISVLENNLGDYFNDKFNVRFKISVTLTREDIANLVGTAKEACIRTLTSFRKEGWISTKGKRIKLNDKAALQKLIDGI